MTIDVVNRLVNHKVLAISGNLNQETYLIPGNLTVSGNFIVSGTGGGGSSGSSFNTSGPDATWAGSFYGQVGSLAEEIYAGSVYGQTGSFSGSIFVPVPTGDTSAATKKYVDDASGAGSSLNTSGPNATFAGSFYGNIGSFIENVSADYFIGNAGSLVGLPEGGSSLNTSGPDATYAGSFYGQVGSFAGSLFALDIEAEDISGTNVYASYYAGSANFVPYVGAAGSINLNGKYLVNPLGISTGTTDKPPYGGNLVYGAHSSTVATQYCNSSTGKGLGDGAAVGLDADENLLIWQFENKDINFATNGDQRMQITEDGHIHINDNDLTLGTHSITGVGSIFGDTGSFVGSVFSKGFEGNISGNVYGDVTGSVNGILSGVGVSYSTTVSGANLYAGTSVQSVMISGANLYGTTSVHSVTGSFSGSIYGLDILGQDISGTNVYASQLVGSVGTQFTPSGLWLESGAYMVSGPGTLTTKGDVYTYAAADARLAVGTNNQVLMADSTETTGNKWADLEGMKLVDRGDPADFDFIETDLNMTTTDYRDLDLSAIVPAGATAVTLRVIIADNEVTTSLNFRKNGNTNTVNRCAIYTQVADKFIEGEITVSCDASQVIEYSASRDIDSIYIAVKGWYIPQADEAIGAYISRGDVADFDRAVGDFTTDGTWRDWDISAIVPSTATSVYLRIILKDGSTNQDFSFRKNGDTNNVNAFQIRTQVANIDQDGYGWVDIGTDGIIEYKGANTTFTTIAVAVLGWRI